jgi:hypothetical protein
LRLTSVTVIFADGTAACDLSVTTPRMEALNVCAQSAGIITAQRNKSRFISPSIKKQLSRQRYFF